MGQNGKAELVENGDDTVHIVLPENKNASACAKIDEVGWISFVSFSWVFSFLWSVYKGRIDPSRPTTCSIFDSANVNVTRLEHLWSDELKRKPENPSLFMVILRFMKLRLLLACLIFIFCLVFGFIGPTCLVRGLISFTENEPRKERIDYMFGLYLVLSILIVEVSRVLMYGATWAVSYRTGIRVRGAVLTLLYKNLLSVKSLRDKTPSEIVNICANDGQRIFDAVTFAPLVLIGPLVIVGGLIYLLRVIGPWSLLGVSVFFVFDLLQAILGITMVKCRNLAIAKTEKRMTLMGEIIRCIRTIKMNSWEDLFAERVMAVREEEKRYLRIAGYAQSLAVASGTIVPVVATIVTVLSVVLSGSDLLASDAFSAITVFFVMLFGIRMIPYGIRYLAEARSAIVKIQEFLLFPKCEKDVPTPVQPNVAIALKNASFSWDAAEKPAADNKKPEEESLKDSSAVRQQCLQKLTLTIEKKELIGVCGAVGSGKSALLSAVLGHLIEDEGDLAVAGSVAHVGQVPFILNTTVRENILFGQPMNTQRYYKVISACQLTKDLEAMPSNELSEVGERGTALSGGQRARLALARALYANKDIYLLDDVFASIDKKISDAIFENAIKDLLATKTILLVTSDPDYLAKCDRVMLLDRTSLVDTGTPSLVDFGPHEELLDKSALYKDFFASHQSDASKRQGDEHVPVKDLPAANGTVKNGDLKKETSSTASKQSDEEEDLGLQDISAQVYAEYIRACGGFVLLAVVLLAFVVNVSCGIFSTFWLSKWMKDVHQTVNISGIERQGSLAENDNVSYYASVYGFSLIALFATGLFKAMVFVKVSLTGSTNLHNRMLHSVLAAVTAFFDTTPTGRILNRFSKDMDEIDVKLPFASEALLQNMITCIGFLGMIVWVFPLFLLASFPLCALFLAFYLCFRAGIRGLKRTENLSRSPLFDHVSSSLDGITTIHSFGQGNRFLDGFKAKLDEHSGAMFMFNAAVRWQAVWLDLLVVAVTFVVALFIVLLTGSVSPADAGMALSFALQMSGIFQFAVRSQTALEAHLTAVERVSYYYNNIECESDKEDDQVVREDWPRKGDIRFEHAVLRYSKEAPPALKDVTFEIGDAEKIGIIGRTGSGKSSICNVLFRLYPLEAGDVYVDDVKTTQVSLKRLRRSMAVIPQDAVLFSGTLRFNIDPENKRTDDEIWATLDKVGLRQTVTDLTQKLDFQVESGGNNLSSGERQLLCVVRALLRKVKIVVLDEATSNMDTRTDLQAQLAFRETFSNQTLLLVTHRVHNVADMDAILRVDEGQVSVERAPQEKKEQRPARAATPALTPSHTPKEEQPDSKEGDDLPAEES